MAEYINRETVLQILSWRNAPWDGYNAVKILPAADVQPVVYGQWVNSGIIGFNRCSNCKALWDKQLTEDVFFHYCPRCGAKMRMIKHEHSN